MANSIQVEYMQSVNYGSFTTGKTIIFSDDMKVCYWKGCNHLSKGRDWYYLQIAGSHYVGNSLGFAHHIYRFPVSDTETAQYCIENIGSLKEIVGPDNFIPGEMVEFSAQLDEYGQPA